MSQPAASPDPADTSRGDGAPRRRASDRAGARRKILLADDDASMIRLLKAILGDVNADFIEASDGDQALELAQREHPDLILLDVGMPKRSGWDVCQALKAVQRTADIGIILVTGRGDVRDRLTGLQVGADDYLVKPFNQVEVIKRVNSLLEGERELTRAAPPLQTVQSLYTVLQDPATGLPTVPLIVDRLREMLIEWEELGVIHIDVEQFELIESEYGWAFFDEFLRRSAEVLLEEAGRRFGEHVVACNRVGGSSFYIFFDTRTHKVSEENLETEAQTLSESLTGALYRRFPRLRSGEIGFFVGGSCLRYHPEIRLERQIYRGMKNAAEAVRDAEMRRRRALTRELQEILEAGRISTVFQPIAAASDGSIFGYEVLTRGPKDSSFANSEMLFGFARQIDLLPQLEELSLRSAIDRIRTMENLGDLKFLVNLEAEMFESDEFRFNDMMDFFSADRGRFVFELTERAAIEDYAHFRELLQEFREKGVEIAIDDAGSGYASLEAIASLEPDYLKITKSLVSTLTREPIKQDLIRMLVELAGKTGSRTLAEGIETREEYDCCIELGIDLLQGYYIGHPAENLEGVQNTE
jgi:EAL domain-containing protein (putative c-di-GMP-specific phosphodiesterase class I)/FixJ family two-component response regulator